MKAHFAANPNCDVLIQTLVLFTAVISECDLLPLTIVFLFFFLIQQPTKSTTVVFLL